MCVSRLVPVPVAQLVMRSLHLARPLLAAVVTTASEVARVLPPRAVISCCAPVLELQVGLLSLQAHRAVAQVVDLCRS